MTRGWALLALLGCASGGEGDPVAGDASTVDSAMETSSETDGCVEGPCSPGPCRRGSISCATGACRDEGTLPVGTSCGVFAGLVCNASGECVPCMTGEACAIAGSECMVGKLDCSAGKPACVSPAVAPKNTACGTNKICDAVGKCVDDVITVTVSCATGAKTGNALCADKGFASATTANGYFWFQCAGPTDCPGGFKGDGTTCPDFCGGKDCVGVPYCGGTNKIGTRTGDGTTSFRADDSGYNCTSYNPGWMVRLRCRY
jgi:hypothetical protein